MGSRLVTWTLGVGLLGVVLLALPLEWPSVVRDGPLYGEAAEGTNREGHRGLAGRRIVGGWFTKAQGSGRGCPSAISVHFMLVQSSRSPCTELTPLVLYSLADVLLHVLP